MSDQRRRVAEELWWPVWTLDTQAVVELLREGSLRPDDVTDETPSESMLMLAILAEVEQAMHGLGDYGVHEAFPSMSGLLLAAGANPEVKHQRTGETALDFCESRAGDFVRHPRAARLLRFYAR